MSRTVLIWTACVAIGLLIAIAQKMLLDTSPAVGLATVAVFMFGGAPVATHVASWLGFETSKRRRNRSARAMVI